MDFIKDYTLLELEEKLVELGFQKFRAKQIYKWLNEGVTSFEEMTNISKDMREKLSENFVLSYPTVEKVQVSKIDGTRKYLFKLQDGEMVESVLMQYKHGNSICVSSQVGCKMGCKFCASGLLGLTRNLRPSEILDQVIFVQKESSLKISNIVLMGIGEPLDNYDNVLKFLRLVNDKDGLNIGHRHISLSTCGVVDKIYKLMDEKLQITLSISLHSPDDLSREKIMPINKKYNIDTLIKACKDYFDKTGRRISYEYTMIDGVSDSVEQAKLLVKRLKGKPCHVNLIPLNSVEESGLKTSSNTKINKFREVLEKNGISATVRRTLGPDIDASCGQLRKREIGDNI
ncbi:MAG: 23S rRNA (adenine(2503)-C(2))-methyltransferase RlmN [Clostridia bacterium]